MLVGEDCRSGGWGGCVLSWFGFLDVGDRVRVFGNWSWVFGFVSMVLLGWVERGGERGVHDSMFILSHGEAWGGDSSSRLHRIILGLQHLYSVHRGKPRRSASYLVIHDSPPSRTDNVERNFPNRTPTLLIRCTSPSDKSDEGKHSTEIHGKQQE